jgi:hypothetical protein
LRILIIILFIGLGTRLTAQVNLVPNPSFEDQINCIDSGTVSSIYNWSNPTNGTPDIHAIDFCNLYSFSVYYSLPDNPWFGYQNPRTGLKCAGVAVYDEFTDESREYLQVQLLSPLKPGTAYCVEMYVSLANNYSKYAINDIGIHFNNDSIYFDSLSYPVISYLSNNITSDIYIADTLTWTKINGIYIASGGEKYILIGNFKPKYQTDYILNYPQSGGVSYYFIDDVSVIECDSLNSVEENEFINDITIYPNPASAIINLSYNLKHNSTLLIYNSIGQLIEQKQLLKDSKLLELPLTTYANGMYIYTVTANGKTVHQGKFVVSKN